jgi:hypothetical protein
MELRRGLIRNLVFLYHCALSADSFSEVLSRIERLLATPQSYRPRTMLQRIRIFFEEIEGTKLKDLAAQYPDGSLGSYTLQAARSLLRMRIRNCWRDLLSFVDTVLNEVGCYPELDGPKEVGNHFDATFPFCETLQVRCTMPAFVEDHRGELEKVLAAISQGSSDRETEARIAAMQSVLGDPFLARHHQVCWRLGDVVICIEAPPNADILNDNARHMDPICKALGKCSVHWRRHPDEGGGSVMPVVRR